MNKIIANEADLPVYLYVVTRSRTRAGKPPMKIAPIGYGYSGNKPVWIKTQGCHAGGSDRLFALEECHETLESAESAMNLMIEKEVSWEQGKLSRLKKKFAEARSAAKKVNVS